MITDLPTSWSALPIGDCCAPVSSVDPKREYQHSTFLYVDISSVDNVLKVITGAREVPATEAPSRARQLLRSNDVLVSTVRPGLNAVALVPNDLDGAVCSTGFCVLRANKALLQSEFLFMWVKHPGFVERLIRLERGIGFPAVSDRDVKSVPIPLPPLPEQQRIVAILRQADELCQLRCRANERAKALLPALFLEMFGDPISNPKGWDIERVERLGTRHRPVTRTGPFGSSLKREEYRESGIPVWGIDNVQENEFVEDGSLYITPEKYRELKNYVVQSGDILISRAGTTGRICVARPTRYPSIIGTNLIRVVLDDSFILPEYFSSLLSYFPGIIGRLRAAGESESYSFINSTIIVGLEVPVPPRSLQDEFRRFYLAHRSAQTQRLDSARKHDALVLSLVARAFTGELTAAWREARTEELAAAAAKRDRLLGDTARRPRIDQTNLSTEAMWTETVEQLAKLVLPSSQQLLEHLGTTLSLVKSLEQQPFLELSKQLERIAEVNASFVNAALYQSVLSLPEGTQRSLAMSAERIRQAMNEWSSAVSQQHRRAVQLMMLSWAERLAEIAVTVVRGIDRNHPRYQMLRDLSDDQHSTYLALQSVARYATVEVLAKETGRSPQQVTQDLALLTGAGLIQTMAVSTRPMGDQVVYVQVYRALQPSDDLRSNDLEQLKKQLEELSA